MAIYQKNNDTSSRPPPEMGAKTSTLGSYTTSTLG